MKRKIILAAVLVFIIFAASFFIFRAEENSPPQEDISVAKNEVVVYVSGQVKTPAVITLEDNGNLRLIDAVNAAGGLTEFADTEIVNLAEPLTDGQHVHIPTKEIIFRELPAQNGGGTSNNLININTADEKELQKIKGIGPALAGRVIEYRESHGAFKSIEEIKKVRGIGDKTFEKMRDQITV